MLEGHRATSLSVLMALSLGSLAATQERSRPAGGTPATKPAPHEDRIAKALEEARSEKARYDEEQLGAALKAYLAKNGSPPEDFDALTRKDAKGNAYVDHVPKDPWDHDYLLVRGAEPGQVEVVSRGPDGRLDTADDLRWPRQEQTAEPASGPLAEARSVKASQDVETFAEAVKIYMVRNGILPDGLDVLARKDERGNSYLDRVPRDPWGNRYLLVPGERRTQFEVVSKGPDGKADTEDDIRYPARQAAKPAPAPGAEAPNVKVRQDLEAITDALKIYQVKNGRMPDGLDALVRKDERGNSYLSRLPKDPWGNDYLLVPGEKRTQFEVVSKGPDGKVDTEDDVRSGAGKPAR